jgi:hypothetical protein
VTRFGRAIDVVASWQARLLALFRGSELGNLVDNASEPLAPSSSGKDPSLSRMVQGFDPLWGHWEVLPVLSCGPLRPARGGVRGNRSVARERK